MKTASDRLKEDIATVRKMKGPQGFGWLSRGGRPLPSDGREGDFYLDASTLEVYKKLKSGWVLFGRLKGPQGVPGMKGDQGPRGEQGIQGPQGKSGDQGPQGKSGDQGPQGDRGRQGASDPLHLLPYIAQHAYYYVYVHPSRFESIERTSKNNYTASNLLDFTGKTIPVNAIDISKDDERFYITLGRRRTIPVKERFNNLFEDNKAFAMFQVFEVNTSNPTQLFFDPFRIDMIGHLSLEGLSLKVYPNHIEGTKFTSASAEEDVFAVGHGDTVAAPKLTSALGRSASTIGEIAGHRCVLSFSRDSDGKFAIYLNSVLIYSHADARPFRRINNIEDADYFIGASFFLNDTTSTKLYCQLHFSKSLSADMIKRIHAELMTHYDI